MSPHPLRLGTRGSPLALYQARTVAARLQQHTGTSCEIVVIRTSGDQIVDRPLSEAGGKRLFVKEIEEALLARDVDLAVHSSKDLPAVLPDGLVLGGVLPRERPTDALVSRGPAATFERLARDVRPGTRIGTGSIRRIAQLRRRWPSAAFESIRGNVDTRLRKLDAGEYDLIVLAAAGLTRLGLADRISADIPPEVCVPAPGQGIIAIEVRADDEATGAAVARLGDPAAGAALAAERAVVVALGGGCQMPIGAYAQPVPPEGGEALLELTALVVSPDGERLVRRQARGSAADAAALGRQVGAGLLADGAGAILDALREPGAPGAGASG